MKGLLLKESLSNLSVLDCLRIINTEIWDVQNATGDQPSSWTALSFEVDDHQDDMFAEHLSQSLKPKGWYVDAKTETHVYVIFPNKVFKYSKGDKVQREIAQQYGRLLNIPDKQLDWGE
jgi:hypothetical protein